VILDDMERKLRPPEFEFAPYPAKSITLASGERMVVRQCAREEVGTLLETVFPLIHAEEGEYYDLVGARMLAELIGWYRYRMANVFTLVGAVDGEIVGLVTSRMVNEKLGMSLHTMAIRRGMRIGAQLFAAKMEYHFDILNQEEVWIISESPLGVKLWMLEYALEDRTAEYPEVRHENGGVPAFVLTRALYDAVRDQKVSGTRPVEEGLLRGADILKAPRTYPQLPGYVRQ
jgi:hypothetical protein